MLCLCIFKLILLHLGRTLKDFPIITFQSLFITFLFQGQWRPGTGGIYNKKGFYVSDKVRSRFKCWHCCGEVTVGVVVNCLLFRQLVFQLLLLDLSRILSSKEVFLIELELLRE